MSRIKKEKLEKLYLEKKLPIVKIAKKLDRDRGTISRRLDDYKIPKRSRSEIAKNMFSKMSKKEKKAYTKAANKKSKELAKKGNWGFQKTWKEERKLMMKYINENVDKIIKNRTNGMKGVTGKDHHNWNPDLTAEERTKKRRKLQRINWRKNIFKRDNYTCQICGDDTGGNLVAHHIYSYMDYPKKRALLENGITLCENCHKEFHKKYGYGENTKKQFEKFKKARG